MKVSFVKVNYEGTVKIPANVIEKLPKKVMLFLTAQLMHQKESIIEQLKKAGKKVVLEKPRHTREEGQILGCDTEPIEGDFEAFFYVGDGMFHPQALIIKNDKPVHVWDHANKKYLKLTNKDADMIRKKLGVAQTKFLMSKNIGVLITTKPGQNKLLQFMKIRTKYPDKEFYFLVNNNVDFKGLEDFPFVECFVNTACERIATDDYSKFHKSILNFEDLP